MFAKVPSISKMTALGNSLLGTYATCSPKYFFIFKYIERNTSLGTALLPRVRLRFSSSTQGTSNVLSSTAIVGIFKPEFLILDEPTRGIDVGSKEEIHRLICQLANQGMGIILISSELPEVLAMSDRILVMYEGNVQTILDAKDASQEMLMSYAVNAQTDK